MEGAAMGKQILIEFMFGISASAARGDIRKARR
jgi:hypothetical protein